jgi:hypothetical protein
MGYLHRVKLIFVSFSILCLQSGALAVADQNNMRSASTKMRDTVIVLGNVAPSSSQSSVNEPSRLATGPSDPAQAKSLAPRVRPHEPLTSAIASARSPRRRAALRIAEEARNLLEAGQYEKALRRLETSLGLDANRYNYFYLAVTHHRLAHYAESIAFLSVAEAFFYGEPDWIAELSTLKQINYGGLQTTASGAPRVELARPRTIQETPRAESTSVDLTSDATSREEEQQNALVYLLAMSSSLSFLGLLAWLAASTHVLRHAEK